MTLRLLGGARLDPDGEALPADQTLWMCAVVASRGAPVARELVATLLWPDAPTAAAQNRLRQLLHRAKRSPLGRHLQADSLTLHWSGAFDVAQFRRHVGAQDWDAAIGSYAGPLLDGVPLPAQDELATWLEEKRASLHGEYLQALLESARAREERGDARGAADLLALAHDADPLSEVTLQRFVRLLRVTGDVPRARRVFDRYQERLQREMGEEPSPELTALLRELKAFHSTRAVRHAPPTLTSFVGRARELATLQARLTDPACRWVTLSGPGGAGKTRLALEAARMVAPEYRDDVVFVALAPLASADLIATTILNALGQQSGRQDPPAVQLSRFLQSRSTLLVLDNFEHLLDGADLLLSLLGSCPHLKLLVTSRQRLNYQAEWVLRLNGLEVPGECTPSHVNWREFDGARLFVERATRADATLDAERHASSVLRIVRRCEGLPLALELAAAWVADFSVNDIAERLNRDWDFLVTSLRDVPPRHRSLRVVFEHSWRALPVELQRVYAALAVLRTPFDVACASHVAHASKDDLDALERRSLLQRLDDGVYAWHQNLREYALAKLDEDVERCTRERHLAYFVEFAETLGLRLRQATRAPELEALHARHDDLRAALTYARDARRDTSGLRMAGTLYWFWYVRGHHEEGLGWLDLFLERSTPADTVRARALSGAGGFARERGLYDRAAERYRDALSAYRAHADERGEAEVLQMLGNMLRDRGEHDAAEHHLRSAAALFERLGDHSGLGMTHNDLGVLCAQRADKPGAREHFRRSLALKRQVQDLQGVAYALGNLGAVADDPQEELRLYEESLVIKRELGDVQSTANTLANCAMVALDLHQPDVAQLHFVEALGLFRQLGKVENLGPVLAEVARLERMLGRFGRALELAGAAVHHEHHTGVPLRQGTRSFLEQLIAELRDAVPDAEACLARGARLQPLQAVEYALSAVPAQGTSELAPRVTLN